MAKLWKPKRLKKPAGRKLPVEYAMLNESIPNPYTLTEADIGRSIFGGRVSAEDVGLMCQLVLAHDGVTPVLQMENRYQRDARLARHVGGSGELNVEADHGDS